MESSQLIPCAEVERMMKLQDVLLKAMATRISWLSAAEIIGVTPQTMRRERLEEQATTVCAIGEKGRPASGGRRWKLAKRFCGCTRRSTWTLNVRHFHEKLQEVERN